MVNLRLKNRVGNSSQIIFGKYNGKSVEWVLKNDPEYFYWLYCNVKWCRFYPDILKVLNLPLDVKFKNRKSIIGSIIKINKIENNEMI